MPRARGIGMLSHHWRREAQSQGIKMSKRYVVFWIDGDELGLYEADDEDGAILAAVKDAGYASMDDAQELITDEEGNLVLQAVEA